MLKTLEILALAIGLVAGKGPAASADEGNLAASAVGILRKYCYRCHGLEFKVPGYDVLNRTRLVAARDGENPYISPGKLGESELWARFDEMPPKGPKPTAAERSVIKDWILAGAPFPVISATREFVDDKAVQTAIRDHLRTQDRFDRPYQRYFTIANLHNNPKISDEELGLARAGVSKMVNSLSRKPSIAVPSAIGPGQTVLALDIRKLGWNNSRVWMLLLSEYPYGLKFTNQRDREFRDAALEIESLLGPDVPLADIRADWFLDTAGRPEIYDAILELPNSAQELEKSLRIDTEHDFRSDALRRAGFTKSGVSRQMRVVDRHDSELGHYWKSYDFKKTDRAVNLFNFPLGPVFATNPFPDQAFTHAGGELIFSLPNRLQGYMLVNRAGQKIKEGPADIVFDANDSAGSSTIVSGMSCMGCHRNGMILFRDRIREGAAVADEPRRKVERLFPDDAEMTAILKRDEAQFLQALDLAVGPFLRVGADKDKPARDFREPIIPIARIYQNDLDVASAAAELNIKDVTTLLALIKANPRLQRLGMADLMKEGGAINRAEWGTAGNGTSAFQQVCSELERGTPRNVVYQRD
jgi:serine/threonine-protein kinase